MSGCMITYVIRFESGGQLYCHEPHETKTRNLVVKYCILPWCSSCCSHRCVLSACVYTIFRHPLSGIPFLDTLMFRVSHSHLSVRLLTILTLGQLVAVSQLDIIACIPINPSGLLCPFALCSLPWERPLIKVLSE